MQVREIGELVIYTNRLWTKVITHWYWIAHVCQMTINWLCLTLAHDPRLLPLSNRCCDTRILYCNFLYACKLSNSIRALFLGGKYHFASDPHQTILAMVRVFVGSLLNVSFRECFVSLTAVLKMRAKKNFCMFILCIRFSFFPSVYFAAHRTGLLHVYSHKYWIRGNKVQSHAYVLVHALTLIQLTELKRPK